MENWKLFIQVLEKSVEKNGSIALTTGHLLNIAKIVDNQAEQYIDQHVENTRKIEDEIYQYGEL